MTQGERVKLIRRSEKINLTLEKFGEKIGIKKSAVSKIEKGENSLTDSNIKAICREFGVNEEWLRTGDGEMFKSLPEEDEVAAYVSELLEDANSPLCSVIVDIMKTFQELTPESQEALREFSGKLLKNIKKEKES